MHFLFFPSSCYHCFFFASCFIYLINDPFFNFLYILFSYFYFLFFSSPSSPHFPSPLSPNFSTSSFVVFFCFFLAQCTNWRISAFIVWADGITSGVLLKYHDVWKSWCDLRIHLWWNEGSLVLRRKWPAVVFGDWNVTSEYYPTVFPFKLYYYYALCRDLSIFIKYAARCITKSRKARSVHISLKRHILHVWILSS